MHFLSINIFNALNCFCLISVYVYKILDFTLKLLSIERSRTGVRG